MKGHGGREVKGKKDGHIMNSYRLRSKNYVLYWQLIWRTTVNMQSVESSTVSRCVYLSPAEDASVQGEGWSSQDQEDLVGW